MIQALKVPAPGHPFVEFYMISVPNAPFFGRVHIGELVKAFWPKTPPVAPPAPRAARDMVLSPWDEDDLKELGIVPYPVPVTL